MEPRSEDGVSCAVLDAKIARCQSCSPNPREGRTVSFRRGRFQ